jgi:hypothetical protein
MGWEDEDWIYLIQDVDQWWALVDMVMNLKFYKRQGIF